MNNLKHGAYSRQFAEVGALLASNAAIREALLAIAKRHNLRQDKADEVAALLLTRLFQRAEDVAGGDRLNLEVDADDRDSIKEAGARAGFRQLKTAVRRASRKNSAQVQSTTR